MFNFDESNLNIEAEIKKIIAKETFNKRVKDEVVGLVSNNPKNGAGTTKLGGDEKILKKIQEINHNAESLPVSKNQLMEEKYMVAKEECFKEG